LIRENLDGEIRAFDGYAGIGGGANIYLDYVDYLECCEIEEAKFDKLLDSLKVNRSVDYHSPSTTETGHDKATLRVDEKTVRCFNENVVNVLHRRIGKQTAPFRFIDLDPCGSPFVSVPPALKLIEDGYLAVTYGDIQLQRWGRDAPLTKAYRMPAVESFDEVLEYMIGWTMFEGIRQEHSSQTRRLEVSEVKIFRKKNGGVARVLYRVEEEGALTPAMNHLTEVLQEFERGEAPQNARYDLEEVPGWRHQK